MNKSIWKSGFARGHTPAFPCPNCSNGKMREREDSYRSARPRHVSFEMYEQDPSAVPSRFVMLLECSDVSCDGVSSVAGEATDVQMEDSDGNSEILEMLNPEFMRPAPPLISFPAATPEAVKKELALAFELFWLDYRICASRLRTSMERLMDHFQVAKFNRRGKRRPISLALRIDRLPTKINTSAYSEMLHALRTVGNLGTHGKSLTRATILDAFQLYEMALTELFKDKSETAKAIIRRLKAQK